MSPKGLLFRIAPTAVDSEDDPTPPNSGTESEPVALVRVIPMPINGTHNFEATSYSSGIDDEHPNEDRHHHHYHHQVRRKRNVSSMPANGTGYAHYSSHSNSRLSSSCSQDEDASSQDSLTPFYQNNNGKMRRSNDRDLEKTPAPHKNVADTKTPGTSASSSSTSSRRQMLDFTPDSGIAMSAHGSSSSNGLQHTSSGSGSNHHTSNNNNNNVNQDGNNNTNGESVKLFQQKVARIRRNYRYNFGDDSDSD